jgi:hypothetical protein
MLRPDPLQGSYSPIANFTEYATPEPIPTDILVPCSGIDVVSFVPQPGSSSVLAYTLHITFVSAIG